MAENSEGDTLKNQDMNKPPTISLDELPKISAVTAKWPLVQKKENTTDRSILKDTQGREFRLIPAFNEKGEPVVDEEGTEVLKKEYLEK